MRSVTESVNIQQQRLALRDALGHPEIRDVATFIGVNVQEAQAAVNMMNNVKGLISSVYNNYQSKKGCAMNEDAKALIKAIVTAIVPTPPSFPDNDAGSRPPDNDAGSSTSKKKPRPNVTATNLRKSLGISSKDAARRVHKAGSKQHRKIKMGDRNGLVFRKKIKRSKFKEAELIELRHWMCNNMYTRDSLCKDDQVYMKDLESKLQLMLLFHFVTV